MHSAHIHSHYTGDSESDVRHVTEKGVNVLCRNPGRARIRFNAHCMKCMCVVDLFPEHYNYRTLCLPGCELQISITVVIDKNEQLSIRIRKLSNSTRGAHSTAFLHEYLLSYKTLMQIYVNVLDFQHGFGSNSTPPTLTQICHNI